MAVNSGISFQTPEKFFLNSTHRLHTHLNMTGGFRLCDVVWQLRFFAFLWIIWLTALNFKYSRVASYWCESKGNGILLSTLPLLFSFLFFATVIVLRTICDVLQPECVPHGELFRSLTGSKEIVLLIAPPACGKSTFSEMFDSALYTRINQDNLRTITKCLDAARGELRRGEEMIFLFI